MPTCSLHVGIVKRGSDTHAAPGENSVSATIIKKEDSRLQVRASTVSLEEVGRELRISRAEQRERERERHNRGGALPIIQHDVVVRISEPVRAGIE